MKGRERRGRRGKGKKGKKMGKRHGLDFFLRIKQSRSFKCLVFRTPLHLNELDVKQLTQSYKFVTNA